MRAFLLGLLCTVLAPAAFAQVASPVIYEGQHLSSARARAMITHEGEAWFVASHQSLGLAIFRSGQGGLRRAGGWHSGSQFGSGVLCHSLGYVFYEVATANGAHIWRTDGEPSGDVLIDDEPGTASGFTEYNGGLYYFLQEIDFSQCRLRRAGGDLNGTIDVEVFPGRVGGLCSIGGVLLFVICTETGIDVYTSDGAAGNARHLLHSPGVVGPDTRVFMGVEGGFAWFRLLDEFGTSLLYRSDGTLSGTKPILAGFFPGAGATELDGLVFLGTDGGSLWSSNGDAPGTAAVGNSSGAAVLDGHLYYCTNGPGESALWRTDGFVTTQVWRREDPGYSLNVLGAHKGRLLLGNALGFGLWWHQPGTRAVSEMRIHFAADTDHAFWAQISDDGNGLYITSQEDLLWRLDLEEPRPGGGGCAAGAGARLPMAVLVLPWLLRRARRVRGQAR